MSNGTQKPWPDLSFYGLRLYLARTPGGKPQVVAVGDTEANDAALTAIGFRRHPTAAYWSRVFADNSFSMGLLRSVFPLVGVAMRDGSAIVLDTAVEMPSAQDMGPPARIAPSAEQTDLAGRLAARLLDTLGLRTAILVGGGASATVENATGDRLEVVASMEREGFSVRFGAPVAIASFRVDGAGHLIATAATVTGRAVAATPAAAAGVAMREIAASGFAQGQIVAAPAAERPVVQDVPTAPAPATVVPAAPRSGVRAWGADSPEGEWRATVLRTVEAAGGWRVDLIVRGPATGGRDYGLQEPVTTLDALAGDAGRAWVQAIVRQALGADLSWQDAPTGSRGVEESDEPEQGAGQGDGRAAVGDDDERAVADVRAAGGGSVPRAAGEPAPAGGDADDVAGPGAADRGRDRDGAGARDGAGNEPIDLSDLVGDGLDVVEPERRRNFRLTEEIAERLTPATWNAKRAIEGNLLALRTLRRLEQSSEPPADEDLAAMAGYVGWGGLPGVFDEGNPQGLQYGDELQRLLGEDGYTAARASTINAHYTAIPVIDAMWAAVRRMGFAGGRVLEPGCGIGAFLGRVPEDLAAASRFVAVEKDPTTGALLKQLYPTAKVFAMGYEKAAIPNESVGLVIGNVPFGDYSVYDPIYKRAKLLIHDYFIVKSLDKLRPGGVMAVITSTGTLDKQAPRARELMYQHADLLAAFRLPNDTFSANANTRVTTDLLVFRKRLPGEAAAPFDWRGHASVKDVKGTSLFVNGVFGTPRGHVLGHLVQDSGLYGSPTTSVVRVHPLTRQERPLAAWLAEIPQRVPEAVVSVSQQAVTAGELALDAQAFDPTPRLYREDDEGMFVVRDGRVGAVVDGRFEAVALRSAKDEARILAYIPMRDAVNNLLAAQQLGCNDEDLKHLQDQLHEAYDEFVRRCGFVNERANRLTLGDDPSFDTALALEVIDEDTRQVRKAEVFFERTIGPVRSGGVVDNAKDALYACIDELGRVEPAWIALKAQRAWMACVEELAGLIYKDPETGAWDIAPRYLAGHVRQKLAIAEQAAESDAFYAANVEALRKRVPRDLTSEEIDPSLGAPWIPADDVEAFVRYLYGRSDLAVQVHHNPHTAEWRVTVPKFAEAPQWSTRRMTAADLVECSLRGQAPRVVDTFSDGTQAFNATETTLAIEKQKEIADAFASWLWSDPARKTRLVADYNWRYRSFRSPDYAGFPVTVPGMAAGRALRPHQETGVTRIVMEQNTLLQHPVGFGKTATMAVAAMKLKALGIASKSLVVTPKNVCYQFAREIKRWFPNGRVLLIRSEDLNPKGRSRFWRRVQVRNPDVIVCTPEAFKRLRLPKDAEVAFLNEELTRIDLALRFEVAAGKEGKTRGTREVKRLEKARAKAQERLEALMNVEEKDDNRVTLRDLGIGALFVDEAHRFKNLQVFTRERVLGVPTAASQRAFDMASKVWWLQNNNAKVVFATGSSITNTMAEAYNLQRYLQRDELDATGMFHFDAWKAQFGQVIYSLEPDPGGKGYRTVARLAEMRNVPELVAMMGLFTDAVSDDDRYFARPKPRFETIVAEPTPLQSIYREVLSERVQKIRQKGRVEPGADNILVVLGDARRSSLDLRTLVPSAPEEAAGRKLAMVADKVAEIYHAGREGKLTQAIFLDFATPGTGKGRKVGAALDAYTALQAMLAKRGVSPGEVAFIHDAKNDAQKLEIYQRVRDGAVRIIIGSTEKMGEGANIQDRLAALHHLNAPAHPGHVVQRNGRIIRQGNVNKEVEVFTYVTRGLLEDWAWHLVTLKAKFIGQVMDGLAGHTDGEGLARRVVEDTQGAMSFDEIEAAASDNPLVKEKCVVDAEVNRLELLRLGHAQGQAAHRERLTSLENLVPGLERRLKKFDLIADALAAWPAQRTALVAGLQAAGDSVPTDDVDLLGAATNPKAKKPKPRQILDDDLVAVVGGQTLVGHKAIGEALHRAIGEARTHAWRSNQLLGTFMGLQMVLPSAATVMMEIELAPPSTPREGSPLHIDVTADPVGLVRRLENEVMGLAKWRERDEERLRSATYEQQQLRALVGGAWPGTDELTTKKVRQREINIELAKMNEETQANERESASQRFAEALERLGAESAFLQGRDEIDDLLDAEPDDDAEDAEDDVEDDRVKSPSPKEGGAADAPFAAAPRRAAGFGH